MVKRGLVLLFLGVLVSCTKKEGVSEREKIFALPAINNLYVEEGQQFFKKECSSCHIMEFKSKGPDISDIVYKTNEKAVYDKLNKIHLLESCYAKELSEEEVKKILDYLRQYRVWLHEIN